MQAQLIDQGLERLNIHITYPNEALAQFQDLLLHYNKVMDLTGITEAEDIAIKHFLDSLTIFMVEEFKGPGRLLDLGTGAGFPAIPIRLTNPDLDMTLLDSQKKRLKFLDQVIDQMGLENISTIHGRAEDLGQDSDHRQAYDLVVSRAVANLQVLIELGLPLVKLGGLMVAMKGLDGRAEYKDAQKGIKILGGQVRDIIEFDLSENGENSRTLIVIEKIKPTPRTYPRNYGQIKKKPL